MNLDGHNLLRYLTGPEVNVQPAERVASGSPLEGGDNVGKAPKRLLWFIQNQNPVVVSQLLPVHEYTCVWFLHPNLLCSRSILETRNAFPSFVCFLPYTGGFALHSCLSKIQLRMQCWTSVVRWDTCGYGLLSNYLPIIQHHVADMALKFPV